MYQVNAIRRILEPYFDEYIAWTDAADIKEWLTDIETRLAELGDEDDEQL